MNLITSSSSPTTSLMTLKSSPLPSPSGSLDLAQTEPLGDGVYSAELVWWAWVLAEVVVAAVIVVGDVSLLMMFFTRKLLGQSTNILVFSVAIADLMTGLLVLPLDLLQVRHCLHTLLLADSHLVLVFLKKLPIVQFY